MASPAYQLDYFTQIMYRSLHMINRIQSFLLDYFSLTTASESWVKSVDIADGKTRVLLQFGFPVDDVKDDLVAKLSAFLADKNVDIQIDWQVASHVVQPLVKALPEVKNVIAVASGKGGVGKSTTSINLAIALQLMGARVGLLDADIHGPNQPQMLGIQKKPQISEDKKIDVVEQYGLQTMSIGYLIDAERPTIWRGPMVSGALQQLTNDTQWKDLDYLIIDLPPGTGDVQLTLSQKIPVAGSVIVTTPQEIALADARKALAMFNKVKVPVLGIVENMSYYRCKHCDEKDYLFGQGGGRKMAEQYNVALLGEMPLDRRIREQADRGKPIVLAEPDSELAQLYKIIARRVCAQLSLQGKNYAAKFPNIVVE